MQKNKAVEIFKWSGTTTTNPPILEQRSHFSKNYKTGKKCILLKGNLLKNTYLTIKLLNYHNKFARDQN